MDTKKIDLVTFTFVFDLLIKTLTLAISFDWYVLGLTFHMSVSSDKVFLWVPTDLTL
jgi:hypothetical protein